MLTTDLLVSSNDSSAGQSTIGILISLIFYVISVIALWRIFTKAGRPGWLAIIPVVNVVVFIQISGHSGWSALLLLIPFVNVVWWIVISIHLARSFGRSGAFGFFLLWLFQIIGFLILGFGQSAYRDRRLSTV